VVAQLRDEARVLPLLWEPDMPEPPTGTRERTPNGWRRDGEGGLRRHRPDDVRGAVIQHAIVRYYVGHVSRAALALELSYSIRFAQMIVAGQVWRPYAAPVRRQLAALGIGLNKGGTGSKLPSDFRNREIIAACLGLLADVPWLLCGDARPDAEWARRMARLLTAGRTPLDGGGS